MRLALSFVLASLLSSFAFALGCGGEGNEQEPPRSPADPGWSDDLSDATGKPLRATEVMNKERGSGQTAQVAPTMGDPTSPLELRVRHDLMIAKDAPHEAICSCLSVAVGLAGDARLVWQAEAPTLSGDVWLAAVSAKGVVCPGVAEEAARRPSISGVEREGADVVLTIEELPQGRPLASGAVFLKPGPGGSLYVKPKGGKSVYGKALNGGGKCKVK